MRIRFELTQIIIIIKAVQSLNMNCISQQSFIYFVLRRTAVLCLTLDSIFIIQKMDMKENRKDIIEI